MYSGHGIKQIICTLEHSISSELFNEIIGFKSFGSKKELDLNTETADEVYYSEKTTTMLSCFRNQVSYAKPKHAFLPKNISNT
jgi:hypothetical protein